MSSTQETSTLAYIGLSEPEIYHGLTLLGSGQASEGHAEWRNLRYTEGMSRERGSPSQAGATGGPGQGLCFYVSCGLKTHSGHPRAWGQVPLPG